MHSIVPYEDRVHRQAVVDLWAVAFGSGIGHNEPRLSIDKKLAVNDGLFFVATVGGRVVGTTLAGYDGHRGWLYSVAVDPAFRRSKVGAELVRHAERALVSRGCMKVNLQVVGSNTGVVPFYESLGYLVEDRISMGRRVDG
ncbi:GNAT family acetyltransferase [Pseudorhodoferax sp. Leaf265]|uniref:GNAT family acetyltransferase n=1 Tax=Pseudorhodoferax sp. Leaf265 TaxID=1736315 RepID=UPI0009EBE17B|nr:GNAT family acetyltransferase [Pseudorhodoferax sp. Leaf265]